jgi:hypothetical protein
LQYVLYIAWSYLITINTQSYPYMDKMLADVPGDTVKEKLAHLYYTTQSGMMAIPLLIPGTAYYRAMRVSYHIEEHVLYLNFENFPLEKLCLLYLCLSLQMIIFSTVEWMTLQARALLQGILRKVIADRQSGLVECNDFLQSMLLPMEDGTLLTDDQIMDNIFSILGASDVTTSTCLVWMVKNICEHPKVYEDLQVLHHSPILNYLIRTLSKTPMLRTTNFSLPTE